MAWKAWVVVILASAGAGEAIALPALAVCDAGKRKPTTACCCSHDCASGTTSGPGMRSSCCDMRRAPARGAMPSIPPREVAPLSVIAATLLPDLPHPPAPTVTNAVLKVPPSLHAPPLYDLFRSYRI